MMSNDFVPRDEYEALKTRCRRMEESKRVLEELLEKIDGRVDTISTERESLARELRFIESINEEAVENRDHAHFKAEQLLEEWQETQKELNALRTDHEQLAANYQKLQSINERLIEMFRETQESVRTAFQK